MAVLTTEATCHRRLVFLLLAGLMPALLGAAPSPVPCASLTATERLGRHLFFDESLSHPPGQSCATCHATEVGFTGPESEINAAGAVYPGAVATRFGNRRPPSAAYATQAPVLHRDEEGAFVGGSFWDGRATGERLGNAAAEQAQGPFLNSVEQNLPSAEAVVAKVCSGKYAALFRRVWGPEACADVAAAYDRIALAIAAYEASPEVNAFSSRYDAWAAGDGTLTRQELRGKALFEGKGKCAQCHPPPLFTDYTYDNLGFPRNPLNPFYRQPIANPAGASWVDPGLAGFLETRSAWVASAPAELGKHKVPTLRNVARRPSPRFVKSFGHNGYFKSLEAIVHFYSTRDVLPRCPPEFAGAPGETCWPAPEIAANVNTEELGNLGLTSAEEADLVAFLHTLSDRPRPACAR
jgi:cytochrome c peroxidase